MYKLDSGAKRPILWPILIVIIVVLLGGLWLLLRQTSEPRQPLVHPEYVSFAGSYVFSIPNGYAVDEHLITGTQVLYQGTLSITSGAKIDDVYRAGGITVQPLSSLTDHSSSAFKQYVNTNFIPDLKKNLSTDYKLTFTKAAGWDVAKVVINQGGAPLRYVFIQNGMHPVEIAGKDQASAYTKITQTITDVEGTDLKNEIGPLKQSVLTNTELIKAQNSHALYTSAAPDLRSKNSEADLAGALSSAKDYTQGNIAIDGGRYDGNQFASVVLFSPLNKNIAPASGAMYFTKNNGTWQLETLQLPKPRA